MSCISRILELKGDKEFLPVIDPHNIRKRADHGLTVEGGGEYKGYHYLITFTGCGHRCGYVSLPPGHVLADKDLQLTCVSAPEPFDELDVYGGITFHQSGTHLLDRLEPGHPHCDDIWIGFDAAHYRDGPDWDHHEKYYGKNCREALESCSSEFRSILKREQTVKTYKFMEDQCKYLIDQITEKEIA